MLNLTSALSIIIVLLVAATLYAIVSSRRANRSAELELFSTFGLSPDAYRLLSSDLGGRAPKIFLKNRHIIGVSDAIFQSRNDRSIVIGEAKSRRYRNKVRDRERYQVILYLGLAKRYFRGCPISGVIAYADACVPISYNDDTFRWLMCLVPQFRQVSRRW